METLYSSMRMVSDGTLQSVTLSFPYTTRTEIHVWVDGLEWVTGWTWAAGSGNTIKFDAPIPAGSVVLIRRITQLNEVPYIFGEAAGSRGYAEFSAATVDENFDFILRASQDSLDSFQLTGILAEAAETWAKRSEAAAIRSEDSADASEVSATISQASAVTSSQHAQSSAASAQVSEQAATQADNYSELSRKWAENPEDDPVIPGHFSAMHWALKSQDSSDIQKLRDDLADPAKGAGMVAFVQEGDGAIAMPMLQKARQFLTGEDFGFLPDSGDVTEEGMRLYAIARERKKKVYLAAGTHKISGPLDPSGVETEGVFGGYRNNAGTIIQGDGTHHAFEQSSNVTSRIGYSLKNIHVTDALSALKMGYCAFAEVSHFSSLNVKQGIILSEPTIYGSLWNALRQCNISANEEALVMDGSVVANANLIDTCFFSGGTEMTGVDDYIPAARITASGGYGSLATTIINSEFTGPGVGLEINRASATMLLNPYFESKAASILLRGPAGKVKVAGGVFGSVSNEHPSPNAFIWHRSGGASLDIDGPQIFLDQSGGSQNDMRLIHSDSPGSITTNMMIPPRVTITRGATGWRLFGDGLPTSLGYMNYSDTFIPEISSVSGTPPNIGSGSISGRYSRSGPQVHVDIELSLGAGFSATGDNWLISLPFVASSSRAIGNARISRRGLGVKSGICVVNPFSRTLSIYASENPYPVGAGIPWSWQEGDVISASISYQI